MRLPSTPEAHGHGGIFFGQNQSSACTDMRNMFADRVYVHVVASAYSFPLFPSFFDHYRSLGIAWKHFHFVLHTTGTPDDHAATQLLSKLISVQNVSGHFESRVRRGLVNNWIKRLPPSAWVINSDIDEHYMFPCRTTSTLLESKFEGKTAMCANMLERYAPDFTLSEEGPTAAAMRATFSLCASIRTLQRTGWLNKVILIPARVNPQWTTAHGANTKVGFVGQDGSGIHKCVDVGNFSHFSYTASAVSMLHLKTKQNAAAKLIYSRELAMLEQTASLATRFTAAWAANIAANSGPCPD